MTTRFVTAATVLTAALVVSWAVAQERTERAQDQTRNQQQQSPMEMAQKFIKEHDKNNDGSLARNELPAGFRDDYEDLDANKDGKLSAEEIRDHAARFVFVPVPVEIVSYYVIEAGHDQPTREDLQQAYDMLRKADANNDGQLAESEIQAAREQAIQSRVDAIFKRYDKNNDGTLTREETPNRLHALFNRTDKDNNGRINKEELKHCCTQSAERAGKSGGNQPNK